MIATVSTGFANPAVTIARMFTDTVTGIAPGSAVGFIGVQILGGIAAAGVALVRYPTTPSSIATSGETAGAHT
jgi:glycerol uptake facilitator-like aquaporin